MSKYYRYKVPGFCVFEIRPSKENPTQYILFGDGEKLRTYENPKDAAHDVYLRKTGYLVWDQLNEGPDNPLGLGEWEELDD